MITRMVQYEKELSELKQRGMVEDEDASEHVKGLEFSLQEAQNKLREQDEVIRRLRTQVERAQESKKAK